jgi:hypothetical protein
MRRFALRSRFCSPVLRSLPAAAHREHPSRRSRFRSSRGQAPPGTSEGIKVNARGVNFHEHVTGDNIFIMLL